MKITPPLEWSDEIARKIETRHAVTIAEVEEALFDDKPWRDKTRDGKIFVFAQTVGGRYLLIIIAFRDKAIHLVTARNMEDPERKLYQDKRR